MTIYPNLLAWVQAAWRAKHGDKPLVVLELCRESGITPPAYYRLGEGNSKPETVAALAEYFGVPEPQRAIIAEGIEEPPPTPLSVLREAVGKLGQLERMLEAPTTVEQLAREAAQAVEDLEAIVPPPHATARSRRRRA